MYVNPVTCIERHLKAILVHLAALFGIKYNHQIPLEIFLIQLKNTVINKLSICDSLGIDLYSKKFETPASSLFFMPMYFWLYNPLLLLQIYFPTHENENNGLNEAFIQSELPCIAFYLDLIFIEKNDNLVRYLKNQYQNEFDEFKSTKESEAYCRYFYLCDEEYLKPLEL